MGKHIASIVGSSTGEDWPLDATKGLAFSMQALGTRYQAANNFKKKKKKKLSESQIAIG